MLDHLDRPKEKKGFMDECKLYEDGDPENYGRYVHGYLLPMLDQLRDDCKLKQGKHFNDFNKKIFKAILSIPTMDIIKES